MFLLLKVDDVDVLIGLHLLHLNGKNGLKLFLFSFEFLILFFSMFLKIGVSLDELCGFLFIFFFHVSFIFGKFLGDVSQVGRLFLSNNDVLGSLNLQFLLSGSNFLLGRLLGGKSLHLGTVLLLFGSFGFSGSLDLGFQKKFTILNGFFLP